MTSFFPCSYLTSVTPRVNLCPRLTTTAKGQDGKTELEVHVNDKGRITQIILSDDFTDEDVAELRTKVRDTLI